MRNENSWLSWLDKGLDVAKLIAGPTPLGAVLTVADAIVDETNKEQGINNADIMDTLTVMMKSKWNTLTPEKVQRIKAILEEPNGE